MSCVTLNLSMDYSLNVPGMLVFLFGSEELMKNEVKGTEIRETHRGGLNRRVEGERRNGLKSWEAGSRISRGW